MKELGRYHSEMVIGFADVFDAVSADRCYRAALPMDTCFQIIRDGSGQDFDPLLAKIFLDMRKEVERRQQELTHISS